MNANHTTTTQGIEFIADTPEKVAAFRMLAIKGALKMESVGLKRSRGLSALSIVKKEFGIKAKTAKEAFPLYVEYLREIGILAPAVININEVSYEDSKKYDWKAI